MRTWPDSVVPVGDLESSMQAPFGDSEVFRNLSEQSLALAVDGNDVAAKLVG